MQVLRGLAKIKRFKNPIVALGVFDGLHRGHRNILEALVKRAKQINGTSVVLTFWPHPQREESLYSLEHRLRLIAGLGIDVCIIIKFSEHFGDILAEDFVKDILGEKIRAKEIYIGRNFRFGKNARGNAKMLEQFSKIYDFRLREFPVMRIGALAISSTYIRRLIRKGNLSGAQKLLSCPVSVLGTVIKGVSVGKKLGFPTANINPHHEVVPPPGVYATEIIYDGEKLKGLCYIGTRPTFKGQEKTHIEVHIFNFKKNIYGKYLEIQFIEKIREEKKFDSPRKLAQQIKKDMKNAYRIFSFH
jgi:riboflavin kinase/FMN adenylyltransferase